MREKIGKTGRKIFLFISIYFLGVVSVPPFWNFWDFLKEVSQNPDLMAKALFAVTGVAILYAAWYVWEKFFKNSE